MLMQGSKKMADRPKLEHLCCECYAVVKRGNRSALPNAEGHAPARTLKASFRLNGVCVPILNCRSSDSATAAFDPLEHRDGEQAFKIGTNLRALASKVETGAVAVGVAMASVRCRTDHTREKRLKITDLSHRHSRYILLLHCSRGAARRFQSSTDGSGGQCRP